MPPLAPTRIVQTAKGPTDVRRLKPLRSEVLYRPYQNDFTIGTAGQVISPTNSAGQAAQRYDDTLDIFGNGGAYDATHLHPTAAMAALVAMTNGQTASQSFRFRDLRLQPNTQVVTRTYFWIDAAPSSNIQVIRYEDPAGTAIGGVRLTSGGTLVGWRAANAVLGTASSALPTGQWIRVEIAIRAQGTAANASYLEIRAWWTNPESTGTPDYTNVQNPVANGLGGLEVIDRVLFGSCNSVTALTAAWNIWFAQVATNYTDWVGPATSGAVTNTITFSCSTNISSIIQNTTGKPLGGTATQSASIAKLVGKPIAASQTASAGLTRQAQKPLAGSLTDAATLSKQTGKPLTASLNDSAAIAKQAGKPLSASSTVSGAITKRAGRVLAAAQTCGASLARLCGKPLAATSSVSATVAKLVGKPFPVSLNDSAVIALTKVRTILFTCSTNVSAALARLTGKPLAASQTVSATDTRRTSKTLAASATESATATRSTSKTLAPSATAGATLAKRPGRSLAASTTVSGTLRRRTGKLLAPAIILSAVASMVKQGISHALGRSFRVGGRQAGFGVSASEATMRTATRQRGFSAGANQSDLGVDASQSSFDEPEPLP